MHETALVRSVRRLRQHRPCGHGKVEYFSAGLEGLMIFVAALDRFRSAEVDFHGLQTRESGRHRFVSMHVLVPGAWTVQAGHDLVEQVEQAIREALPDTTVPTHLEPREDPRAYDDYAFEGQPDPPTQPDESRGVT